MAWAGDYKFSQTFICTEQQKEALSCLLCLSSFLQHAASKPALECDEVAARTLRWYQRPIKRRYLIASLGRYSIDI